MIILGISAYYHDSAAALCLDGKVIAAAQEERFSRKKNDSSFPYESILYCLKEAGVELEQVDSIVFYDKPFIKFERLVETYLSDAPLGFRSFRVAIPIWLKEKLFLKRTLIKELRKIQKIKKSILNESIAFCEHHISHAASAFFPSPFQEAAILTLDGVGEWTTTSLAVGKDNNIEVLKEISFPHSLGLLYSAFTYYLGFKVNSGEYKVMGLAPYGKPTYVEKIKQHLIDIKEDGSFRLNQKYFNYTSGLTMTSKKFDQLFGASPRIPESEITQREMDLARSIQEVTEEIVLKLAMFAAKETGCKNLCMAGGVALNCVANGKIVENQIFENIWIQPAAGDAGGALGAALAYYYQELQNSRNASQDQMQGSLLGPSYSNEDIRKYLNEVNATYHREHDFKRLSEIVAEKIEAGMVIGWHQGRLEFGPRALGSRSIIGDPRDEKMQSVMNLKIKFRESFRPFAPAVLKESVTDCFRMSCESPYMLLVSQVNEEENLPAITHVDNSARVQTVDKEQNPKFWTLIKSFKERTGCPVVINTSFNVRGEPIVCSPQDSFNCFMKTEMDMLVIGDMYLYKFEQ